MSAAANVEKFREMMATAEDQRSQSDERNVSLLGAVLNDVGSSIVDFLLHPIDLARFHSALSDSTLRPLLKTALGNNANLSSRVHESSASAIWTARCGGVVRSVVFEASATTREVVEAAEACLALQVAIHLSCLNTLPSRLSIQVCCIFSSFICLPSPFLFSPLFYSLYSNLSSPLLSALL
jgi:hypothetical protein